MIILYVGDIFVEQSLCVFSISSSEAEQPFPDQRQAGFNFNICHWRLYIYICNRSLGAPEAFGTQRACDPCKVILDSFLKFYEISKNLEISKSGCQKYCIGEI